MANIRLYSHYWGNRRELFENLTKPSVMPSVERLIKEGHNVEFITYTEEGELIDTITEEAEKASRLDAYTAIIPPDTIFGAETLYNMFKVAENKKIMVAVPHLRVKLSAENIPVPVSNKLLPKYIKEHMHCTAQFSYDNLEDNVTHGGISIREIDKHLCIIHSVPTMYFCKFSQDDARILKNEITTWNHWDSVFLHKMTEQNRVRTIGSSLLGCMAEITGEGTHLKPLSKGQYNDSYGCVNSVNRVYNALNYVMEIPDED